MVKVQSRVRISQFLNFSVIGSSKNLFSITIIQKFSAKMTKRKKSWRDSRNKFSYAPLKTVTVVAAAMICLLLHFSQFFPIFSEFSQFFLNFLLKVNILLFLAAANCIFN